MSLFSLPVFILCILLQFTGLEHASSIVSRLENSIMTSPYVPRPTPFVPSSSARPMNFGCEVEKTTNEIEETGWLDDDPSTMTYGRRLARFLSRFECYYPRRESTDDQTTPPPNLDAAWAFFEHFTLARHFIPDASRDNDPRGRIIPKFDSLSRAEPGETESPTRLYSFWRTPEDQLADFGLGVGLYFAALRALAVILLIAGLINIPTLLYFSSEEYSSGQIDVITALKGSAICTNQVWKPCPTCTEEDWESFPRSTDRFLRTNEGLTFIRTNECYVGFQDGFVSWISLIFVFVSIFIMGRLHHKKEVEFDVNQQTTQDYSLEVENPPDDAKDPEEWKEFFSQFGHVSCCTITLNNEELVIALTKRRQLLLQIEYMLPPGVEMDQNNLDQVLQSVPPQPLWKRILCCCCSSDVQKTYSQILILDNEIRELLRRNYSASNIFVVFETEAAQRRALETLSVGKIHIWTNNVNALEPQHVFRGDHVLRVKEPPEPSSVRWEDLDDSITKKVLQRVFTFVLSFGLIAVGAVIITITQRERPIYGALCITVLNSVTPYVVSYIDSFESHSDEGAKQASKYTKTCLFRWTNTVIVTAIITPFTSTVTDGMDYLLYSLYAIFLTEMVKSPIFQVTDVWGHFCRHVLGPRQIDQRRMNLNFVGTYYELSERYTDMTKVLFLTFFYSVIFPAGFFFAAITLMVHYYTDKFCLLRTWGPAPKIGSQLSSFSRHYFFTLSLIAFAFSSSYLFASWPWDDACKHDSLASNTYLGKHEAKDLNGNVVEIEIPQDDDVHNYFFCNQDLFRKSPPAFPALPTFQPEGAEWMTPGQERMTRIYGWTSVAVLGLVIVNLLYRIIFKHVLPIFRSGYEPVGEARDVGFSTIPDIPAYIPCIKCPEFPCPLLSCDVSNIDPEFIGWRDPHGSYDKHSLIFDAYGMNKDEEHRDSDEDDAQDPSGDVTPPFGIVMQWPPPIDTPNMMD